MWWVICNPNQWYVGNDKELVPWLQQARVFKDRDEAVAEAMNVSEKPNQVLKVVSLVEAASLEAEDMHRRQREEHKKRKAPCSYLPYTRLFMPIGDAEDGFGFDEFRSSYLAVRGAEVVGILGEADGNVVSLAGAEYDMFMEEYLIVPTCSDCGGRLHTDADDDDDDDDEAFNPKDFR